MSTYFEKIPQNISLYNRLLKIQLSSYKIYAAASLSPRTPNTLDALELLLSENTKVTVDVSARKCEELLVELIIISIANVTNSQVPYKSFQRLGANTNVSHETSLPRKGREETMWFSQKICCVF